MCSNDQSARAAFARPAGEVAVDVALSERTLPFADSVCVDLHRAPARTEVVLGEGKSADQIIGVAEELIRAGQRVLSPGCRRTRHRGSRSARCSSTFRPHASPGTEPISPARPIGRVRGGRHNERHPGRRRGAETLAVRRQSRASVRRRCRRASSPHRAARSPETGQRAHRRGWHGGALASAGRGPGGNARHRVPTSVGYGVSLGAYRIARYARAAGRRHRVVNIDNGFRRRHGRSPPGSKRSTREATPRRKKRPRARANAPSQNKRAADWHGHGDSDAHAHATPLPRRRLRSPHSHGDAHAHSHSLPLYRYPYRPSASAPAPRLLSPNPATATPSSTPHGLAGDMIIAAPSTSASPQCSRRRLRFLPKGVRVAMEGTWPAPSEQRASTWSSPANNPSAAIRKSTPCSLGVARRACRRSLALSSAARRGRSRGSSHRSHGGALHEVGAADAIVDIARGCVLVYLRCRRRQLAAPWGAAS